MINAQIIPPSCRLRVHTLGPLEVFSRSETGDWLAVTADAWGKKTRRLAPRVFKRLIASPGRRLTRGRLQEDLWPDADFELADANLSNALTGIRGAIGEDLIEKLDTLYAVARPALVWVDSDAAEALLKEAENRGRTSIQALPLLEEALALFERGEYLEGEDGRWCHSLRRKAEDLLKQCRLWLAESYEAHGKLLQAGLQYRAVLEVMPPDERALRDWIAMLHRQGKEQDAVKCCQDVRDFVEEQGYTLSPALEQWVISLNKQPDRTLLLPVQAPGSILGNELSLALNQERGDRSANLSPHFFLDSGLLDRLERAFYAPRRIDPATLDYLNLLVFNQKRQLVQGEGTNWYELLATASSHLRLFMNLLESHAETSQQLIASIGEICLLIGDVLFNTGDYHTATRYYTMSLRAAQEAQQPTLQAIALGRYSLLLIDRQLSSQALPFMDEAIRLAESNASSVIHSWLWVVKGEAYASTGKETLCLEALETSRKLLEHNEEREVCYTFVSELAPSVYSESKLLGYKGACYLRLKQPEQAQRVLLISQKSSSHPHHQSLVNADFALALIQQNAPQEACGFATQALNYIQQTHSARAFQRVLSVREVLNSWNNLPEIRDLDEHILLSRQL